MFGHLRQSARRTGALQNAVAPSNAPLEPHGFGVRLSFWRFLHHNLRMPEPLRESDRFSDGYSSGLAAQILQTMIGGSHVHSHPYFRKSHIIRVRMTLARMQVTI